MKHKVTVEVETKKRFLGIPYKVTEKHKVTVDGKTYRRLIREKEKAADSAEEELAAGALVVWEEELVDLFGEDY